MVELDRLVFRRSGEESTSSPPALEVPLASLFRYEVTRNTADRAWTLSLVTVRWRLVLWGRVVEEHKLLLQPQQSDDDGGDADSVDPDKDYALHVVEAIDKTVFAWQRGGCRVEAVWFLGPDYCVQWRTARPCRRHRCRRSRCCSRRPVWLLLRQRPRKTPPTPPTAAAIPMLRWRTAGPRTPHRSRH